MMGREVGAVRGKVGEIREVNIGEVRENEEKGSRESEWKLWAGK